MIKIDKKYFKKAHKMISNIYHCSVVLNDYCEYNEATEGALDVLPVIEYIRQQSDWLYYGFEKLLSGSLEPEDFED